MVTGPAGIIVNLLILGALYEVALRDFSLLVGTVAVPASQARPAGTDTAPRTTPSS